MEKTENAPPAVRIYVLDGREFEPVRQNIPAVQDDWILSNLQKAGATEVLAQFAGNTDVASVVKEARSRDLLLTILHSGLKYDILAGILTEKGKKWTREEADRNAARFANITESKEKVFMHTVLVDLVLGFFLSGEVSSRTSPKSSSPSDAARDTTNADPAISANSAQ